MCVVSMIGEYARDSFPQKHPWVRPLISPVPGLTQPVQISSRENWAHPEGGDWVVNWTTQAEFDELKKDVQELKKLISAAQKFDEATAQPHCEHPEKVELLKKLAALVGVEIDLK